MAKKILLQNGCSMSTPSVFPPDWKTGGKELLAKDWRIQYYFHDPEFKDKYPYGKLIVVKGMNSYKNLAQRRQATILLLEDELKSNQDGYNPITKSFPEDSEHNIDYEIHPDTEFIKALELSLEKLSVGKFTKSGIKTTINHIEKAAKQLRLNNKKISDIRMRHLRSCLEQVEKNNEYSNYRYNKNRSHLLILFTNLTEFESIDHNPVRELGKKSVEKKQRDVISLESFTKILNDLKVKNYRYHRFLMIFFYASIRTTELLSVQKKHVNLANQEYKVLIKKGKQYTWTSKVIIPAAVPFWADVLSETIDSDHYLFSLRLKPGIKKLERQQISLFWKRWFKRDHGITQDFYSLKHLFTDIIDEYQNNGLIDYAQAMASHTNPNTTDIYRAGKQKRKNEDLKNLPIKI